MQITGLDFKIMEMAARIRELREISRFTPEEMAAKTDVDAGTYLACERGERDLNFAFLYRCALAFGVDVTDIIEGHSPKLQSYTLTRNGAGQRIDEAHGMEYYNLAASFKNRIAEPLYVHSRYSEDAQHRDIDLTTHAGQECDIVVSGSLMVQVGSHREVLQAGDSIYYDSGTPHGMIATGGEDCIFYAIVLNPTGEPIPELSRETARPGRILQEDTEERIWQKFIDVTADKNGTPQEITFKNTESFNFAFDIVDELAMRSPEKLALLYVNEAGEERRFTFSDMKKNSNRVANYFKALGIKKGDRIMLVLKRHYQFWFAMLALNKLGAIAIPATCQLQAHDFSYRFAAGKIDGIICTADGDAAAQAEAAERESEGLHFKMIVNGSRAGWRPFDEEYPLYSSRFRRTGLSPCGRDLMLMFFTSGTSGNPKLAAHDHRYPLGHFHTAKYWHCTDPNGLHFTISDTGWAKAMWGKLYGQWLNETAVFTYDFDRFDAARILPLFEKYRITTFCAPPTMLRMMVKQDLSRFDLSSIRHMTTAGEALNPEVYRQFEKATGLQILEGFGQSESTMIIGNLSGAPHKVGSMGKPAPIYRVGLLSREGQPVKPGETGEICVDVSRGAPCGLFTGYYGSPDQTAEVWHGGWYHTGDLAWMDEDGFYWYVGRADDVIKSSGYRIGPFEIESVIMELPYVLECGVSAAPDPVRGQVVKASIVLIHGAEGTETLKKEIQDYVKRRTAPYKYPRIVEFKKELPKTTSGKIIRSRL